ncbi:MAG: hypothetical protein KAH05_04010 [Clostridiales bacterium]|nr:hypothetical protein [Clostridiales bacterium]
MLKKISILMIILLLTITGCLKKNEVEQPIMEEVPIVEEPVVKEAVIEESHIIDEFNELLSFGKANELGIFIDENIEMVDKTEAEYMIEMLVVYQSKLINDMNMKIYAIDYMNALNVDMGGMFNLDLINNIKDETIKKEFQVLVDAKLKIVRYEENPSVETNWKEINGLSEYFTDDFVKMANLSNLIQSRIYDYYYQNFDKLVEDIVETEQLILSNEKSFLSWQLELVYQKQIVALLVGPEGEYLEAFITKEGQVYDRILKFDEIYKENDLGDLIDVLIKSETSDFSVLADIIRSHNILGLKSDKKVTIQILSDGVSTFNMTRVDIPGNSSLEEKINRLIDEQVNSLSSDIEGQKLVFINPAYGTDKYLSLMISSTFINPESGYDFKSSFLTIDLESGEKVTLDEFFGLPFEEYKLSIEKLKDVELNEMPEFIMDSMGVVLLIPLKEQAYSEYLMINVSEIMDYVDPWIFYK